MDQILNKYIDRLELKTAALEEINLELKYKNKKMQDFMESRAYDDGYSMHGTIWDEFLSNNPDIENNEMNDPSVIDEGLSTLLEFESFLDKANQKLKDKFKLTDRDKLALKFIEIAYREKESTIESISNELNITEDDYDPKIHWPIILARRCYIWADAFIKERNNIQ